MLRRQLLTASLGAAAGIGGLGSAPSTTGATLSPKDSAATGPVTLYFEFRVALPEHEAALAALQDRSAAWRRSPGFLSLLLNQMSGESTMVKNYPETYKGLLAEAYLDGVKAHSQPYFYALLVRFADHQQLMASRIDQDFDRAILPFLHSAAPAPAGIAKSAKPMSVYRGVFQSIAAGDRAGLYRTRAELTDFLRRPAELTEGATVTVANHVMVPDAGHLEWETAVRPLLEVAQQTFQPSDDPNGVGQAGGRSNRLYRKALTTEILRNTSSDGPLRSYLMHGVWESVWDHENSHLDPRFLAAAAPVGAGVEIGPVEPFYLTRLVVGA